MKSFEDLGLKPELVKALAAEGLETPTSFQEEALPVIRRGNNLVGRVGPGAGTHLAYGAGLLDRLEPGRGRPGALVLVPSRSDANHLAESLARIARATGHGVATPGGPWARPDRADLLFGAPSDILDGIGTSRLKLEEVEALVLDGGAAIEELEGLQAAGTIAESVPGDAQKVVLSLPVTPGVERFVEGHVRRAIRLPSGPAGADDPREDVPRRGTLRYRVGGGRRADEALRLVRELLEDEARHVLLHVGTDDRAADLGEHLDLHGFPVGAAGNGEVPVWISSDEREARRALEEMSEPSSVSTVSFDVPSGPDSLDRRHGAGGVAVVLLRARELPHLEGVARVAGYRLEAEPGPAPPRIQDEIDSVVGRLRKVLEERELAPHYLMLEPLLESHSPVEVAAAALLLLRATEEGSGAPPRSPAVPASDRPPATAAWVRLFLSVGKKDGVGPGDLLGAVAGEAGVDGSRVGKIEIRDTFSLVEVEEPIARTVIEAVNGTTIKGRSVRADYDRGRGSRERGSRDEGDRKR